jgi:hypothetical protein
MELQEYGSLLAQRKNFNLKFSDAPSPGISGALPNYPVPGYQTGEAYPQSTLAPGFTPETSLFDYFLTRLVAKTPILDSSAIVRMRSIQESIQYMDTSMRFEAERTGIIGGSSQGLYETSPNEDSADYSFSKKYLEAVPMVSFTSVTDNFLQENLETDRILSHITGQLATQAAAEIEKIALFKDSTSSSANYAANIPSSYKNSEGWIKQLTKAGQVSTNGPIKRSTSLNDFGNFIEEFVDKNNQAHVDGLTAFMPAALIVALRRQITSRETNLGDDYLIDPLTLEPIIYGVRCRHSTNLDKPYAVTTDTVTNYNKALPTIFLTAQNNLVAGFMRDLESKYTYKDENLAYLITLRVKFDNAVLYPIDGFVTNYNAAG